MSMTEIELLKRQVEALKELVEIQQRSINELQAQIERLRIGQIVNIPTIWTSPTIQDLCQHEYPFPWHATVPPHCKKCGKQAQTYTVTCSSEQA